jgi:TPR repeat protein
VKQFLVISAFLIAAAAVAVWVSLHRAGDAPDQTPPPSPQAVKLQPDIATLKMKAAQGEAGAEGLLAKAFAEGQGVPLDYTQAAHWYALAATNGNIEAEAALGELYQAGQGVKRDLSRAAQLFAQAAAGGNVTGQFDLAYLYDNGQGMPKNQPLAAKWYLQAAEEGDPTAQWIMGQRCLSAFGVAKDPVQAMKWLMLASAQGQTDAAAKLTAVEKEMTSAQIAEARQGAAAFVARSPDK